jgi:hypothetical protein
MEETTKFNALTNFKKRIARIFGDQAVNEILDNNICVSDRIVWNGNILNLLTVGEALERLEKARFGYNPPTNDVLIYKGGIYNMSQLNLWVIADALGDFDKDTLLSDIPGYEFEGI